MRNKRIKSFIKYTDTKCKVGDFMIRISCRNSVINLIFRICILGMILCSIVLFSSCGVESKDKKKGSDMEFTVVSEENIPKELMEIINGKKTEEMKLTFCDKENLYIVVGYGKQSTGGYSINVDELYETDNEIYIHTNFLGPSKSENISQAYSYPYIVVKVEYTDKKVNFS